MSNKGLCRRAKNRFDAEKHNDRQTAHQPRPTRVTQAQVRKAMIDEIAKDKDKVALINAKLASAYALMSIATLYVDEMASAG